MRRWRTDEHVFLFICSTLSCWHFSPAQFYLWKTWQENCRTFSQWILPSVSAAADDILIDFYSLFLLLWFVLNSSENLTLLKMTQAFKKMLYFYWKLYMYKTAGLNSQTAHEVQNLKILKPNFDKYPWKIHQPVVFVCPLCLFTCRTSELTTNYY